MKQRFWLAVAVLAATAPAFLTSPASAAGSRLSIGLGQGVADTYGAISAFGGDYLEPMTQPEINVGAEYWYSFSDDYAVALAGSYGFSSMKWEGAAAADPEIKATGTSFRIRVGGDRTGRIGDRLSFFMGPGLEFWSGKQKLDVGGAETELESVTRYGVSGRIGGFMGLTDNVSIMGQVGHTFGMASAEDTAKSTWLTNSLNASWGLTFAF